MAGILLFARILEKKELSQSKDQKCPAGRHRYKEDRRELEGNDQAAVNYRSQGGERGQRKEESNLRLEKGGGK